MASLKIDSIGVILAISVPVITIIFLVCSRDLRHLTWNIADD